ncbi:uncharacterized protein FSUBG_3299 [Fusarium subglutinans]|uniref:DUF7918 domain-containing protein n=1 Tax=Gibberella subglutinans TaxID=42677 RepID=A0A8H5V5V3_GIBSU|nr:uncharacterized protein FSUBG_3299 [Fusarium subglutinans]KAF5610383.1 hypothetical protein FSUBG_3299 [Fusarium subglutinans]
MAVLDKVPLITARVRVAGELATEYDPLDDHEPVINLDKKGSKIPTRNCYIESKSGAEFAIEITVSDKYQPPKSHDTLITEVYIDGQWRRGKVMHVPLSRGREKTIIISSGRASREKMGEKPMIGKFVFAPINKISDPMSADKLNEDLERAETLGTIRLCLSTEALQHEMIIPRTPSPEPSATTSIDANALSLLSESDIRRLALERLRDTQIKNEFSPVKREAEEASQSPRRWKFVKLNDGKEAVDLTDD